jgi:hypothetical protein
LFGYVGYSLAHVIDDTTVTVERQWALKASLPAWAHEGLTPEEVAGETRLKKLDELREKLARLADIEEAEYKAQVAGVRAALVKAAPEQRVAILEGFTAEVAREHRELAKLE